MDEKDVDYKENEKIKPQGFIKNNYKVLLIISFIIILIILLFILLSPLFTSLVGQKAPDFSITTIEGDKFNLSDNLGKVIILDIMSTTCPACEEEMEHLRGISQSYSSDEVIIVTIDIEKKEDLAEFKSYYEANWTFAKDTDDVGDKYKVMYIPTIVIIDKDGIIRYYETGEQSEEKLAKEIDKLI